MKKTLILPQVPSAFTLVELVVALGVSSIVLAVLLTSALAIQKSLVATDEFSFRMNNGNRLADAVAQDLRRAVGVGTLTPAGVYTKLSAASPVIGTSGVVTDSKTVAVVTDTSYLAITIPDYYGTNVPDNLHGSAYKTSRYPRSTLDTSATYNGNSGAAAVLNGVVPWSQAVSLNAASPPGYVPKFSSSGTGLIQVRYTRGPRSATDQTVCFFRTEYPSNSTTQNSPPVEIAEEVIDPDSVTSLIVIDPD